MMLGGSSVKGVFVCIQSVRFVPPGLIDVEHVTLLAAAAAALGLVGRTVVCGIENNITSASQRADSCDGSKWNGMVWNGNRANDDGDDDEEKIRPQ